MDTLVIRYLKMVDGVENSECTANVVCVWVGGRVGDACTRHS